jgi:hypothetical protein
VIHAYDQAALRACLAGLTQPGTTTEIGNRLEDLVAYILGPLDGVVVTHRKAMNAAQSEEKDIWFRHQAHLSGLPFSDPLIPVECKNEDKAATADEVTRFATKIRRSGGSDGLLVARAGLGGPTKFTGAHEAIHMELAQGIKITVVIGLDIAGLRSTDDLVDLLVDRYTELRVRETYETI